MASGGLKIDLVKIDQKRVKDASDIYFHWKDLDAEIRTLGTRGINFPSDISELFACYVLGYSWNKGSSGDAIDTKKGNRVIEIKASSNASDLSSFSPDENFDELVFCELDRKNDKLLVYETGYSRSDIEGVMVNNTETFKQQADAKRRPRFSVKSKIIKASGLKPSYEFDIRTCKKKKI